MILNADPMNWLSKASLYIAPTMVEPNLVHDIHDSSGLSLTSSEVVKFMWVYDAGQAAWRPLGPVTSVGAFVEFRQNGNGNQKLLLVTANWRFVGIEVFFTL